MAFKTTLRGWVAEVRDRRRLTSGGKAITDVFIEYEKPDRVRVNYTGDGGMDIGAIYLPADPDTLDDIAKGLRAAAKKIREDWLQRSGQQDPHWRPPAVGGDLNYESDDSL